MPRTSTLRLEPLPYLADSTELFLRLRDLGHPVWLDSARPFDRRGRYDLISAAPLTVITASPPAGIIGTNDAVENPDPFAHIDAELASWLPPLPSPDTLPFQGGAIGLIGYESGLTAHGIAGQAHHREPFPALQVGIYAWAILVDHQQRQTRLLLRPEVPPALAAEIRARLVAPLAPSALPSAFGLRSGWRDSLPADRYRQAFERIQHYIHAGDCYQVNLTRRLDAACSGDPLTAYLALRRQARAPFSAYLESPHGAVLSFSPERLLSAEGGRLLAQPIKGTAPRDADPQRDAALAQALCESAKNRAENLMIVDLLRNDLGHSCKPGSIRVDRLFELQSFAAVHHLVSSVSGELRDEVTPLQALRDSFPGGSITGAPKRRAMQIIDELEPHRRAAFCGAIGYLSSCGRMDFNISIRTLLVCEGEVSAWAGGGIVADSSCDEEWCESENKIGALLRTLEELSPPLDAGAEG